MTNFDYDKHAPFANIAKGKEASDTVWVTKTINNLIGTLAKNNFIIDTVLTEAHDLVSHQATWANRQSPSDGGGSDDGEDTYYNSNEKDLSTVRKKLCKNDPKNCMEELRTHTLYLGLSLPIRVAMAHFLFVILCLLIGLLLGIIIKIIEVITLFAEITKPNSGEKTEDKEITKPKSGEKTEDKADEPTKWVDLFKNMLSTIRFIWFGLGPDPIYRLVMYGYLGGFLFWLFVHVFLWLFSVPEVVTFFGGGKITAVSEGSARPSPPSTPGILYTLRPPLTGDYFKFIKSPWIVTPMDARDSGNICKAGFKPSVDGDVQKRKKVTYEEAKNLKWCITDEDYCPFGGSVAKDDKDYKENNIKTNLKFTDIGDTNTSFDERCQSTRNFGEGLAKDIDKFAKDTGKKIESFFKPKK